MRFFKIYTFFIFTLVVSNATGQDLYNNLYLNEKVKSVQNSLGETFFYDKKGKLYMKLYKTKVFSDRYEGTLLYYYNKEGNIEKIYEKKYSIINDTVYCDSLISMYLYENGKKSGIINDYFDSNRKPDTIEFCFYDKLGNLTSKEQINGLMHFKTIYKYGQDTLLDTIFKYNNLQRFKDGEDNQFSDTIHLAEGIAYSYNNQGKLISEIQFLPNYWSPMPTTNYEYNDIGKLVKIQKNLGHLGSCTTDQFVTYETIINIYYNGLLTETNRDRIALGKTIYREIIKYDYNKKGLLIKETTTTYKLNVKKELETDWKSISKYQYKYY